MQNKIITLRNKATDKEPRLQETPTFTSLTKVKVKNVKTNLLKVNNRELDILIIQCKHIDETIEKRPWIFKKDLTNPIIEFPEDSEFKLSIPDEWKSFDDLVVSMELECTSDILIINKY